MKTEEIQQMFGEYEHAVCDANGVECWSARELCKLLGYSLWQNFTKVIDKAKVACENVGHEIDDHFIDVNKMVSLGSGAERQINDVLLTRYACYLVAQNRPLADFLPTISIKAKDFAAEMTSVNVQNKDLQGERDITAEHEDNNRAVRQMLIQRGIVPENLPAAEDVKKVERRLATEEKKAIGNGKKKKTKSK